MNRRFISRTHTYPLGLKLHEDWGTTPAAIDACMAVAERYDVQVRFRLVADWFD